MTRTVLDIHTDLVDALRPVWSLLLPVSEHVIGSGHPFVREHLWYSLLPDLTRVATEGSAKAWRLTADEPPNCLSDLCSDVAQFLQIVVPLARGSWSSCPSTAEEWEELRTGFEVLQLQSDALFRHVLAVDPEPGLGEEVAHA